MVDVGAIGQKNFIIFLKFRNLIEKMCLALTCLQSACLSNEHAPPARKFQKQTQRYMKMPENLSVKKWLFLTLFGKCCST